MTMLEFVASSGLLIVAISWCVFVTKAVFRQDKAFAVIKIEMKHDREKLAKALTLLEKKLC